MKTTAIIGAGALGLLFGEKLTDTYGKENISFVMDEARWHRHHNDRYTINGKHFDLNLTKIQAASPADLIIIATKYSGLTEAIQLAKPLMGENTVIISLLNGIVSEQYLAAEFGTGRVLGCVAIGMDANRTGTALTYASPGKLQLGALCPDQEIALQETASYLQKAGINLEIHENIHRAIYAKFMLNVGVNQTCAVYDIPYGPLIQDPFYRSQMIAAMKEAISVAQAEGIDLNQQDLDRTIALIETLAPDLSPSMRQDLLAGRRTEVDLFAGTVLSLAQKHALQAPVNQLYSEKILQLERYL